MSTHYVSSGMLNLTKHKLFLVVALKTQAKITKSTTPTLQKRPLYNCFRVLLLHTAALTKDLEGKAQVWVGQFPLPQRKTVPVSSSLWAQIVSNMLSI